MNNTKLQIVEQKGDLFDIPSNTLIAHACNCKGSWNAGIAKEFMNRFPQAYIEYNQDCMKQKEKLLGKSKLIISSMSRKYSGKLDLQKIYFIGCLFTSYDYGKNKDSVETILEFTKTSIIDILSKVKDYNSNKEESDKIKEITIPRINAGLFGIPWNKTKDILESINIDSNTIKTIKVITLDKL